MNILILDDDQYFLDRMKTLLELENHSTTATTSWKEALQRSHQFKFDLIITDLKMPKLSGIEFIKKVKKIQNDSIIIVITGYGTIESAVEAIRSGAYDYLRKPFDYSILKGKIQEIEKNQKLKEKIKFHVINEELRDQLVHDPDFSNSIEEPYLLISDENPNVIAEKYNLIDSTPIWLNFNRENGEPFLSSLENIKEEVDNFTRDNQKGTIILKGIENLSRNHNREKIYEFLVYIQTTVLPNKIQFLILVEKEKISFKNHKTENLLSDLINTALEKIIEIITHPLRRKTILLLNTGQGLSFHEIISELEIDSSPVFAFHLRKLVKEEILVKQKIAQSASHKYNLSLKGIYLAEIIQILEKIGEEGPFSSIKILEIQKATPV